MSETKCGESDLNVLLSAVQIPGLPGTYSQIENKYECEQDKTKCPACGGLGIPWAGWFNCERASCKCKALVDDGRAFIPDSR